jgi:hypothetical protein
MTGGFKISNGDNLVIIKGVPMIDTINELLKKAISILSNISITAVLIILSLLILYLIK